MASDPPFPFSEPAWHSDSSSPYYSDSHRRFQRRVREFVDAEIAPHVREWDEAGDYPDSLAVRAHEAGLLAPWLPPELGGTRTGEFDVFTFLVWVDELSRAGAGGVVTSCFLLPTMSLPPIIAHAAPALRDRVVGEVARGRAVVSLAVTEPGAGSDVAAIETTATLDAGGEHYVVSGTKKFITGGLKASWFTTAVRTGGPGGRGVSLLVVPRDAAGVRVERLKTSGWWSSGTTRVVFDGVRVPRANLLGREGAGLRITLENFNLERLTGAIASCRNARLCLEHAAAYARQRKTFGRRLADHQVIRHKIAGMAMRVEAAQAVTEQAAFAMKCGEPPQKVGARVALAKVLASRALTRVADEAGQVFGGAAFLRGGKGEVVERIWRELRVARVGGGSEEVLLDLVMKMSRL